MINKYFLDWLDGSIELLNIFDNLEFDSEKGSKLNPNFINFIKSFIEQKWIENILMNYKDSIDWKDFSSHNYEQYILWLTTFKNLEARDNKRYFTWSVPYANYIFKTFLDMDWDFPELKTEILSKENPLLSKYNDISKSNKLEDFEKKFKFIAEYLNEVSHSIDSAWIWWMSWATDFLQLYKYVMIEEIIKKEDRIKIIEELFNVLKYDENKNKDVNDFIKNYDNFIKVLKEKNINDDKRLSRLYNRLYFIFSFVLNNQKPEEFPIYFSATRNALRVFWVEWYENVVKIYKEFLWNNEFEVYIKIYLEKVWIKKESYWLKEITVLSYNEKLFIDHAKYRFFQDLCWVLNKNVLDWQDFVNNLWEWNKFNFNDLKDKEYLRGITFSDILNIKYLIDEWCIKEISPWEYQVVKTDDYYIKNN